jgi:hypothetical protein
VKLAVSCKNHVSNGCRLIAVLGVDVWMEAVGSQLRSGCPLTPTKPTFAAPRLRVETGRLLTGQIIAPSGPVADGPI